MARQTTTYTVTDEGRDNGKTFLLTEMPSSQAEAWAIRTLLALAKSGVDIPDSENLSLAKMAEVGFKAISGLNWDVAKPLLDEMFSCIRIIPDISKPHVVRDLIEQDIEEVKTRMMLRIEVWKLHTDFLKAVDLSGLGDK